MHVQSSSQRSYWTSPSTRRITLDALGATDRAGTASNWRYETSSDSTDPIFQPPTASQTEDVQDTSAEKTTDGYGDASDNDNSTEYVIDRILDQITDLCHRHNHAEYGEMLYCNRWYHYG